MALKFKIGDKVCQKNNPSRIGIIIDICSVGDGQPYEIPSMGRRWWGGSEIKLVIDKPTYEIY